MRNKITNMLNRLGIVTLFCAGLVSIGNAQTQPTQSQSGSRELFDELARQDSLMFNAVFITCNLKDIETVLTEDFEFYPDNGTSVYTAHQTLAQFMEGIRKNFCEKKNISQMRREIEQGSLQVFPLTQHEVVQTGIQHFYAITTGQKDKLVEVSRFTRTWRMENGRWRMSKEFDAFANTYANHPQDSLTEVIARQDSLLFDAYNRQDLAKIQQYFTDDLEFYHDKGGLTNYAQNIEAFKTNFAKNNGLHRELVPGSLEVYPVKDFGAMEIGDHKFCHQENGKSDCGTFKFAMIWKKTNQGWKISRVISYGH